MDKLFVDIIRSNEVVKQSFIAFLTKNPHEAARDYEKKTGHVPTILIVRPDFVASRPHPLLVPYRFAAFGAISVSHLVKPSEVTEDADPVMVYRERDEGEARPKSVAVDYSFPTQKVGRPERHKATCPHCQGWILDFNTIGFWYGWAFGITPPYWDELRLYVFRRDDYICQKCHKKYPPALLQAHHLHRKEDGGEDGARNLQTLCTDCHGEHKPIFEG